MKLFVGVTDYEWFSYLSKRQPDELNFWRPTPARLGVLQAGEPFLFKLKSPINRIAGAGFYMHYTSLPLSLAWEVFGQKNGAADFQEFRRTIAGYRNTPRHLEPEIGCIVLSQPVFLDPDDWIDVPVDWRPNIVRGKSYSTEDAIGASLWARFQDAVQYTQLRRASSDQSTHAVAESPRYGEEYLARARLGQGGFRSVVTDAYGRRCAMTGERTLPVLQASHIKPYSESGPHRVDNGMLLRADLHILFDRGYLTVTKDYHVEVSPHIREQYENGRDYYAMHGSILRALPHKPADRPSPPFIEWHNEKVYLP